MSEYGSNMFPSGGHCSLIALECIEICNVGFLLGYKLFLSYPEKGSVDYVVVDALVAEKLRLFRREKRSRESHRLHSGYMDCKRDGMMAPFGFFCREALQANLRS